MPILLQSLMCFEVDLPHFPKVTKEQFIYHRNRNTNQIQSNHFLSEQKNAVYIIFPKSANIKRQARNPSFSYQHSNKTVYKPLN